MHDGASHHLEWSYGQLNARHITLNQSHRTFSFSIFNVFFNFYSY